MFATREAHLPATHTPQAPASARPVAFFALVALAVVLVSFASTPWHASRERAAVFPAALSQHVTAPAFVDASVAMGYAQPADAAQLDGLIFVLDTGNNRILAQNHAGAVSQVIDGSVEGQPSLQRPMAIATDGRYLYVANTGASQVLVLEPDGSIVKTLDLPPAAPDGRAARPVGLAVRPGGGLVVTDPDNNRVLFYGNEGQLQTTLGGSRAAGSSGFSAPGGVAVDGAGFVYVVDILNSRVVKLSPDGTFLQQFGRPGDTAGTFSRPKDVAVDAAGNVYVSDGLLAVIQVFSAEGDYLGFIGRTDPGDASSRSLFMAPAGLTVDGDTLYVVDRFAGLFAFQIQK
jgi:DNA-binding beta-propeller fold protein YncE